MWVSVNARRVCGALSLCMAVVGARASAQQAPPAAAAPSDYRVGPDDVLTIAVLQAPELNAATRVSATGEISVALIGSLRVEGLTAREVEQTLKDRLREKYIRDPQLTVQVTEVQSHPVTVVGSVRKPGVFQVRGTKTLLEVLSLAEGIGDDAGSTIVVERGSSPIQINLKELLAAEDPHLNVRIFPGDVVKVPRAAMVYVVGEVKKPGGFSLSAHDQLTVLRAIALGEGLTGVAARDDALIVRTNAAGQRTEVRVRLGRILKAKDPDVVLQSQDVLFVPASGTKAAAQGALNALTRIVSWRPFIP
jgi:polysaccharide biosynthesis/export protein